MATYGGVIIEESLSDTSVLELVDIASTKVEPVTEHHKTPWLKQWTLHTVEIAEEKADAVAERLSKSLDNNYWYADFKNNDIHFIIFPNKVFKIERARPEQYDAAVGFGLSLNMPDYQLDFSPTIDEWKRNN